MAPLGAAAIRRVKLDAGVQLSPAWQKQHLA